MTKTLHGLVLSGIAIAGMSLLAFSAAAESPKEMGRGWGGKCAPAGQAACCKTQRNGDTACKNLEREKAGSAVVKNCEEAEKICLAIVEEARKAEEEKRKKAEEAKKADEAKKAEEKKNSQQGGGQQKPLPNLRLDPNRIAQEIEDAEADLKEVGKQLDLLDPKDPNAKQKFAELYARIIRDNKTIVDKKTILGQETSVIVTHPVNWDKITQTENNVTSKSNEWLKKFEKICTPAGAVSSGDSGGKTPPPTQMEKGTPGQHIGSCKFDTSVGSWK